MEKIKPQRNVKVIANVLNPSVSSRNKANGRNKVEKQLNEYRSENGLYADLAHLKEMTRSRSKSMRSCSNFSIFLQCQYGWLVKHACKKKERRVREF